MKKTYIAPEVDINDIIANQIVAMSYNDEEPATDEDPILVKEDEIWGVHL